MPPSLPLNGMKSYCRIEDTYFTYFFALYTIRPVPTAQKIVVIFALLAFGIRLVWETPRSKSQVATSVPAKTIKIIIDGRVGQTLLGKRTPILRVHACMYLIAAWWFSSC